MDLINIRTQNKQNSKTQLNCKKMLCQYGAEHEHIYHMCRAKKKRSGKQSYQAQQQEIIINVTTFFFRYNRLYKILMK